MSTSFHLFLSLETKFLEQIFYIICIKNLTCSDYFLIYHQRWNAHNTVTNNFLHVGNIFYFNIQSKIFNCLFCVFQKDMTGITACSQDLDRCFSICVCCTAAILRNFVYICLRCWTSAVTCTCRSLRFFLFSKINLFFIHYIHICASCKEGMSAK